MDLSLVPLADLIEEIKNRHDNFVLAVCRHEENNAPIIRTYKSKRSWMDEVGLASILHNDLLNNYNSEMQFLQKIASESEEDNGQA